MKIREEKAVERGGRNSHKSGAGGGEGRVRMMLGEELFRGGGGGQERQGRAPRGASG